MTDKLSYKFIPVFFVGLIDGITVPLTLYAFFIRVLEEQSNALYITAAGGVALAIMLGIGAYLTRKTEIENQGESRLLKIYDALDINETIKAEMAGDTLRETDDWQKKWLDAGNATGNLSPLNYALIIGFGYVCGLTIVLINGFLTPINTLEFLFVPLVVLAVIGFTKFKLAGQNPLVGSLMIATSGAVAVLGNWLVAGLF